MKHNLKRIRKRRRDNVRQGYWVKRNYGMGRFLHPIERQEILTQLKNKTGNWQRDSGSPEEIIKSVITQESIKKDLKGDLKMLKDMGLYEGEIDTRDPQEIERGLQEKYEPKTKLLPHDMTLPIEIDFKKDEIPSNVDSLKLRLRPTGNNYHAEVLIDGVQREERIYPSINEALMHVKDAKIALRRAKEKGRFPRLL